MANPNPILHPEWNGKRINDAASGTGWYLMLDGMRRGLPNMETYDNLFRDRNGIDDVLDIADIMDGGDLTDGAMLVSTPDAGVCLITDGMKRHIADPATMDAYYFDWGKVVAVPSVVLAAIPEGPEININPQ